MGNGTGQDDTVRHLTNEVSIRGTYLLPSHDTLRLRLFDSIIVPATFASQYRQIRFSEPAGMYRASLFVFVSSEKYKINNVFVKNRKQLVKKLTASWFNMHQRELAFLY